MSVRLRGWLLVCVLGGTAVFAAGCGPKARGKLPVDSPIYQAPNDDPSAEEDDSSSDGSSDEGSEEPAPSPAKN